MEPITTFAPELARSLPLTDALLRAAGLTLHPAVERVALSGSRGLGGRPRPDSDVDLSLVIARDAMPAADPERERLLRAVLETTLSAWRGPVECDLAAVYDVLGCGLRCYAGRREAPPTCERAEGCRFGIYKLQKGFEGYVPWSVVDLARMPAMLEIWRREGPPLS